MYKAFEKWLNGVLEENMPIPGVALNFNLYEEADFCWSIQLIGASCFDEEEEDWCCEETFSSGENRFSWKEHAEWEEILDVSCEMIRQYISNGKYAEALKKYQLKSTEPMQILCSVGGLDIAGLCGVFLGGAKYHIPIVIDGVISAVAALTADRLSPGTKEYMIPSHRGKEPASELLMKELGLHPVIDAGLALGEGTGAVMMFSLLDMAMTLYETGATFGDFHIEEYHRF